MTLNQEKAIIAALGELMKKIIGKRDNTSRRNMAKIFKLTNEYQRLQSLRYDFIHLTNGYPGISTLDFNEACSLI